MVIDEGATHMRTHTGKEGPDWSRVKYRTTQDSDNKECLENRVAVKGLTEE